MLGEQPAVLGIPDLPGQLARQVRVVIGHEDRVLAQRLG